MGHEVIIYGAIECAWHFDQMQLQQSHNKSVLGNLPTTDEWPWLTRSMFTLPDCYPQGIYQTPVIHFGLSMKDGVPRDSCTIESSEPVWPMRERECVDG